MRSLLLAGCAAMALGLAPAFAEEFGTADEAQAMLTAPVDALTADKDAALAAFTAGEAPFREKDLYVFCGGEEGFLTAHGANADLIGMSMSDIRDAADEPLGDKLYAAGVEGEAQIVEYVWPRPGEEEPTAKSSYVTKVGDQTCAVGYYQK